MCSIFPSEAGGALRGGCGGRLTLAPRPEHGWTSYYNSQKMAPRRKALANSSVHPSPSRALNLTSGSSSVTKKGSRSTPSQKKPSNKLSSAAPSAWDRRSLDEAVPSLPACPTRPLLRCPNKWLMFRSWATFMKAGRLLCSLPEAGEGPGTGCGKCAHWPGEATRGSHKRTFFPRLQLQYTPGRANRQHPKVRCVSPPGLGELRKFTNCRSALKGLGF